MLFLHRTHTMPLVTAREAECRTKVSSGKMCCDARAQRMRYCAVTGLEHREGNGVRMRGVEETVGWGEDAYLGLSCLSGSYLLRINAYQLYLLYVYSQQ
ncbi:hypothetical protein NDU88_006087 [Pleurodeles waltl]|uniref:Uncharacterized protein n=1 Tax=Pleurodeles waltl TaxID=8319 RepID=A0AAV7TCH5_PLEWA|nr:hypothetical protein NDU88_006087 [Pleurodeles waltl]